MVAVFPLTLVALGSLGPGSLDPAQDPWILVDVPSHVFELDEGCAISVAGEGFFDATPTVRVFDGQDEVTSQVTVTLTDESRIDSDSDGLLEDYTGEFAIAFDQYVPEPGRILRAEVSASAPGGAISAEDATAVRSHMTVVVDDTIDFGDENVGVAVTLKGLFVDSQVLRLFLGSTEVTSMVTITGPVTVYEVTDPGTPPFVRHRDQYYTVDVSGLGEFQGRLTFAASASGSGRGGSVTGDTTGTSSSRGDQLPVEPEDPGPCEQALDDFMDALQLSGGGSTGDPVSVGASAQQVKDAADALQDALEANDCPLRGQHTGPGGQTMKYRVGKNTVSGKNVSAMSKVHDLVVAVGGDGSSGSTGGNATAKNMKPGGAAVAVGGDGGSGTSNPGTGGSATASAVPATGAQPAAGQAASVGGYGGHHVDPSTAGGQGGTASSSVGRWGGGSYPGGFGAAGTAGNPGTAGGGGYHFVFGSNNVLDPIPPPPPQ